MEEKSQFNQIKRRIEANLTKEGEQVSPDIVTREAVEEVLAGFLWADDPLQAALEYWEDMPPGSASYTVRGYAVNAATVRDAVRAAKRLRKSGIVVAPSQPMFYATVPASAGVIHGEVAREFWGLIRTKYNMDWPGIVRESWDKVAGRTSPKKIKAMAKSERRALQGKVLTLAWDTLRHELKTKHGKTVSDVQREAWERVLGVRPGTPVRPVKPKSETPAPEQSTRKARPKKERGKKVTVHVAEPTEEAFDTPYGPVEVLWNISPQEAKDLGRLIDMIFSAAKQEHLEILFVKGASERDFLPKGTIPVRINNRVFAFSRSLLDLCAKQGVPLRIGIMEKGEGAEKSPFLAVAVPRGHYLMPYAGPERVRDEGFEFGYPLGVMIAAIRGHPEWLTLWADRVLHITWPPTAKKEKMRSFSIITPEDNTAYKLGDTARDQCTRKLRQKSSWGNYAIGYREGYTKTYVVGKIEELAKGRYTGFWADLMGFRGKDIAYKAEILADFMASHAPDFGEAFAEHVKNFTTRKELDNWIKQGGHTKLPQWKHLQQTMDGLDRHKVVGASEFRMELEKRWAKATGATVSPTIPARQWIVLSWTADGKKGVITALGELVFGKGWKFGKDPKMDRQVEELYMMLRKEGKLKAKGRHYLISPEAYKDLGPSSELAYFQSRGMGRARRPATHRYFVYNYYTKPGEPLKFGVRRLDEKREADVRDTLPTGLVDLVTVSAPTASEALKKGEPHLRYFDFPAQAAKEPGVPIIWATRRDVLNWVEDRLGQEGSRELAEAMLRQLQDRGYISAHATATGYVLHHDPTEDEWLAALDAAAATLPAKGGMYPANKLDLPIGSTFWGGIIRDKMKVNIGEEGFPYWNIYYLRELQEQKGWDVGRVFEGSWHGTRYKTKKEALEAWEKLKKRYPHG